MFRNGFRYTDSRELKVNLYSVKTKQNLRNTTIFQLYTIKDHLWSLIPCIQLPPNRPKNPKVLTIDRIFSNKGLDFQTAKKRSMPTLK